jgi:predicted NBD/HSP70 family sugar kinase
MFNPFQSTTVPITPISLSYPHYMAVKMLREQGKLSRTNIAELIDYSPSKITSVANDLIAKDIIVEVNDRDSTGGRRAKELFFNPSFGYFIAISISVNKLDVALVDFSEKTRIRQMLPLKHEADPGQTLQDIADFIFVRLARLGIPIEKIYGVGITLPGAVNRNDGTLYDTPALPGWGGYQIESFIRELFPYALVVIERDAHAMAFAELRHGQGKIHTHFIYLYVGHTISAGLILASQIYHGANGRAGDIGNMKVLSDGEMVNLDHLASPIFGDSHQYNHLEDISTAAQEGDTQAQQFIENIALQIGQALSTLVSVVDPEIILIGGLAQQWGHPFLAAIRRHILEFSQSSTTQHLQIDIAPLGDEATITGIVALTAEQVFVVEAKG